MTLKNVPDDLYEPLRRSAERHRRSIDREAIVCLEQALRAGTQDTSDVLARVRAIREQASGIYVTDADSQTARTTGRP